MAQPHGRHAKRVSAVTKTPRAHFAHSPAPQFGRYRTAKWSQSVQSAALDGWERVRPAATSAWISAYSLGADLGAVPAVIEFDPGSLVLTTFSRLNAGTIRGDKAAAGTFLNSFFRI